MRIPNLTHGSLFMLGAYFGVSLIAWGFGFWLGRTAGGARRRGVRRRRSSGFVLRRLAGAELAQVLVTLGLSFMIADACLMQWGGDPISVETPAALRGATLFAGLAFPTYRLAIIVIAVAFAAALWALLDRTRLGAMIRAGVDDPAMARVVGIRVSQLFTIVFCLGAGLAGFAGVIGGPILSVYPGPRPGHAAAGAGRRDPRRLGQPARLAWSAASSSAFSTISARRCCPSSPMSCCSCRC